MIKGMAIDFVRQVIVQTLEQEHMLHPNDFYGGDSQVNLFSFYEQLQKEEQVKRYVERYKDLIDQENRTGLIMNGTLIAPENPTITNINQCLIIPMSFTCSFRVALGDRDMALATINNLIEKLKGRKQDIAEFSNGELFMVGTIANDSKGTPTIKNGDYIGQKTNLQTLSAFMTSRYAIYTSSYDISFPTTYPQWFYFQKGEDDETATISVVYKANADSSWEELTDHNTQGVIFPPSVVGNTKYKLSMAFDSIRVDEPKTLNAKEHCIISFGGSATLVSRNVKLGNEMTKVGIRKDSISGLTTTFSTTKQWLEPLEMPSGNNADTQLSHLMSNNFKTNTHTDSLAIALQYTFIVDYDIFLIRQFFDYARYGIQGTSASLYTNGITPNMVFEIDEIWSSWGTIFYRTFKAKIVESIDIENSESDVLTITIPFQVQGDNN